MEKGFYVVISCDEIIWADKSLSDARVFAEGEAIRQPGGTFVIATVIQTVRACVKTEWTE